MRNKGRIVVAIGGNSLITPGAGRGNRDTHEVAREVCEELSEIAGLFGSLVVTHGNGPQVGYELIRNAQARDIIPPDGMDVNVAATQGIIGYFLQQVLGDVLEERGIDIPVSSVITQVQVKPDDSGFQNPTKPVGPFYTEVGTPPNRTPPFSPGRQLPWPGGAAHSGAPGAPPPENPQPGG